MSRRKKLPQIRFHKPTGQAYVRLSGRMVYFGNAKPGNAPPEVQSRYEAALKDWIAGVSSDRHSLTVDELSLRFMEHARGHYRKNGEETSEVSSIQSALRVLIRVAGRVRVGEFGPLKLQEVRSRIISLGWTRKSINQQVNRIRRVFRWGVSQELVPAEVLLALESVAGLRAGRSKAVESSPVTAVANAAIEAIRPFVSRQVWARVQLQRFTGMRPEEVVLMRGCDLVTSGQLWEFRPESHKTEHHGRDRIVILGPRAQQVVQEFLRADLSEYLFSPAEARLEQDEQRRE